MLNALAWVCARAWLAYAWLCHRTSRFSLGASAEPCLARTWDAGVPTLFLFWHDELLVSSLLGFCTRLRFPLCTPTDSFGGQVMAYAWRTLGAPLAVLPRAFSREQKLRRLERGLRSVRRLGLSADHGKPRFAVRTTAWQLARRVEGARIVVLHVEASSFATLFGLRVPLPFSRYTLELNGPFVPTSLEETRKVLDDGLRALRDPDLTPPLPAPEAPPAAPPAAVPAEPLVAVGAGARSYTYAGRSRSRH